MSINKQQSGFALIEVLVTSVIIAIGVSGLGILLMRVIQGTQDSAQQSQAMWIVQDFVGRIRSNAQGGRSGDYEVATTSATFCDNPPAAICAEYYKSGAEVSAVDCAPGEMATFDKWITVCGIASNIYDSPSDFILNPRLVSTCSRAIPRVSTSAGTPDCIQYDVTLTWDTRITQASSDASERIQSNTFTSVVELN